MPIKRDTLKLYRVALSEGRTILNEKDGRNRVHFNGQWFQKSTIVYFVIHSEEEPLGSHEQIHHKDHNRTNDDPSNLARVNREWHRKHHDRENDAVTKKRPSKNHKSKPNSNWIKKLRLWVQRVFVSR
jgi:hypothetical protein